MQIMEVAKQRSLNSTENCDISKERVLYLHNHVEIKFARISHKSDNQNMYRNDSHLA